MVASSPTDGTTEPRRRRARSVSAGLTVVLLGVAGWAALRRRRPRLPVFAEEARPSPTPRPVPTRAPGPAPRAVPRPDRTVPLASAAGEAVGARVEAPVGPPAAPPAAGEQTPPAPAGTAAPAPATGDALLRVSGIGRRSADALAAAGIDTLRRLADSDDDTLVAALEAGGLRRSPTLSTWANQARRLAGT